MATNLSDIGLGSIQTEADLNDAYAKINAENEQLNEEINTLLYGESLEASPVPAPVEFATVLPNVVEDRSRTAPLPPEKSEFARKEKETNTLAFNKVKGYEGSSTKRYLDTNLDPTIGIGHLIKSDTIKKLMSIGYSKEDAKKIKLGKKEMTEEKVNELFQKELPTYIKSTRRLIKNYDSLSSNLRSELIQLNYRGDLKQGKKTRKLINAGKFKEAAKELLKHEEYNDLKSKGIVNSITKRLEAARDALLAEGTK